ncbi:guanitoxin biosynthesis heme-dependent pre-guanitoxin N-hydroxylase GntA [Sphingomonas sp.]|jgi:FPC/CPF motif-containing protein YcgG|uniref:guanitoxin biosynthesis heme-dependent pre-guanitoxin N-hydroxylase GntA n=1 Tax=Sphingomonas sp. TaxID=28214 RepID=UPI002639674D|nr:guanitoxin biosynthesis heme-dependent pre-guanitoxin N-hydroxylase GntA [Sphingomonas sp.]MDK2766286.1 YqcI/YcgG family protein [Sphingomonas sp.]
MLKPCNDSAHPLAERFRAFVKSPDFPCVGAKSALSRDRMRFVVGKDIGSAWDDLRILPNLHDLAASYRAEPQLFQSLVVLFEQDRALDEPTFEANLWARLQSLTDKDEWLGQPGDPRVSHDPDDPHFSLSFGGEAFFVVGLHPQASRPARRFDRPALVFNLHDQFEQLRAQGRYEKLRDSIVARDVALAGAPNPMLAQHGTVSEARQYSGRVVDPEWRCPFRGRGGAQDAA